MTLITRCLRSILGSSYSLGGFQWTSQHPRYWEVAMGRSRTSHQGGALTEKQDKFVRLIAQDVSN